MKILHTSDWHLGKYLENYSRLDEQALFLDDLYNIVTENDIDLILIAGDIYDTMNPPAKAEALFYQSLKRLSNEGKRPIVIIAGNHDSPERLSALNPLSLEQGIVIVGTPSTVLPTSSFEHYKIVESGKGFIELEIKEQHVVILTMAYPSEKRMNEMIFSHSDEDQHQSQYSEKMRQVFFDLNQQFRGDTINLMMGHFYITGGEMESSERDISLGGNFAIGSDVLPTNAQYIAMGHLHRPQKIAKLQQSVGYYSGSPLQYDKSEIRHPKCVYVVEVEVGQMAKVEKIYLPNHKPIEVWKVDSVEAAIERCTQRQDQNCYVYLEIQTDRPLLQSQIKQIRELKKDIIDIAPIFPEHTAERQGYVQQSKSIAEEFQDFYKKNRNADPSPALVALFLEISQTLEEGVAE